MTETSELAIAWRARASALQLYLAATILSLIAIAVLVVYSIRLGTLIGPGVEQSFGLALAILFLFAALLSHLVDRLYRAWPLGRKFHPTAPGPVEDRSIATLLKVAVLVGAGLAIAYLFSGLIATSGS